MKLNNTEGKKIMLRSKMQIKKDSMSFNPKKIRILKSLRRD
jgi:hypothetical protein